MRKPAAAAKGGKKKAKKVGSPRAAGPPLWRYGSLIMPRYRSAREPEPTPKWSVTPCRRSANFSDRSDLEISSSTGRYTARADLWSLLLRRNQADQQVGPNTFHTVVTPSQRTRDTRHSDVVHRAEGSPK